MGYYPPYIPESSLQAVRITLPVQTGIERVKPIAKKGVYLEPKQHRQMELDIARQTGKGQYFDQFV